MQAVRGQGKKYSYPTFGMGMPNRNFNPYTAAGNGYRYGFNGKENDPEAKGPGNSIDFGSRIYDPRIGRWMSVDPQVGQYPNISPFAYCLNNPVIFKDKDGGVVTDPNGNIIVTTKGQATGYYASGPATTNAKGETTQTTYKVDQLIATAYTDKFQPFEILITVGVTATTVTTDANGMVLKTENTAVDKKQFDASANCHGLAYLKGQGWISDPSPILSDEYSKSNYSSANVVVSVEKSTDMIGHSTTKNANGTFTAKDTDKPIHSNTTFSKAAGSYANPKVWTQTYYQKNSPNNTILTGLTTQPSNYTIYDEVTDQNVGNVPSTTYSTDQIKGFQFVAPSSIPTTEKPK